MNEYFDIGGERATQPPEPDITERELDALRRRWRSEIEEDAKDYSWWEEQDQTGMLNLEVAASLLMRNEPGAAKRVLGYTINRALEEREREELSHD